MLWRCHHKQILTQVCAFISENLALCRNALKDPLVCYEQALRRLTPRCIGDMRPCDNHTAHNTLGKKKKQKSVQMEALFCLFISSRTNAAQRRSSSVAFRGANKIILACVLLPQTPPLEMLLGRVGCWVCVCGGEGGVVVGPCVLRHEASRVHLTFLGNKPTRCNRNAYTMFLLHSLPTR